MKKKFLIILTLVLFVASYTEAGSTHVLGAIKQPDINPSTGTYQAGYYNVFTLQTVDSDLTEGNIKNGVCIFNTTGTFHGLPDTGQLLSYSTYYVTSGNPVEDSHYNPATSSPSYTDNGDGTITDNRTGLMWVKSGYANTDTTPATTYTADGLWRKYTWENALAYCDRLVFPVSGGYTDWRLPSVRELQSIVIYNNYNPSIDTTYFTDTSLGNYWTSTSYASSPENAWNVLFSYGFVDGSSAKTNINNVRPVRGGQ